MSSANADSLSRQLSVLFIEDSEDDVLLMVEELARGGYQVKYERVDTPEGAAQAFRHQLWDVVVCDYAMPHFSMSAALGMVQALNLDIPFIIVSGTMGEDLAVAAMKAGVHDYIMKGNLARLPPAIEREMREAEARRRHRKTEQGLRLFFELSPDLMVIGSFDGRFEQVSRSWEKVLGYSRAELCTRSWLDFVHPADRPATLAFTGNLRDQCGVQLLVNRLRCQEGSWRWIEWHAVAALERDLFYGVARDITERRRREQVLARSERRYRKLFEENLAGVYLTGLDGTFLDFNSALMKMLGYDLRDELFAKRVSEFYADATMHPLLIRILEEHGIAPERELLLRRKDGSTFHALGAAVLLADEHTGDPYIQGVVLDITHQKEAEQRIAAAMWRAETLAQVTTELLSQDATPETMCAIFSRLSERLGLSAFVQYRADPDAQMLRLIACAGLPKDVQEQIRYVPYGETDANVVQMRQGGISADAQSSSEPVKALVRALGIQAYVCFPLRASSGLVGTLAFTSCQHSEFSAETLDLLRNVSEQTAIAMARRDAEDALRASEGRFRQLADSMPQIVWTARPDGFVDYFNQKWREYVGEVPAASGDQSWMPLLHPDDRAPALEMWRDCVRRGANWQFEHRLKHHSGEYRWNLARALPVRDEAGHVTRWFGTSTDIHDQKLTEQALKRAHRHKDEFLAMLGHELRNPLAPIRNAAHILRHAGTNDPMVRRSREMIDRQVSHMARLIDDLLDVSRVTSGKIQLKKELHDLTKLVRAYAMDYQSIVESCGLSFEVSLPDRALPVFGDPARIQQIVGNLLNNAVKFTDPGGKISLSLVAERDKSALIVVQDTGIGLDPAMLDEVFEPFSQADRSIDRSHGGLGLGLALVKGLAELHGGSICAESAGLGRGSRFVVRLPLDPQTVAREPEKAEAAAQRRAYRILIIEDNVDAAESLRLLLSLIGHEVAVAHAGFEGLKRAHEFRPEIVLCDIGLPGEMDGYAFARAIRSDPQLSATYMIAMTGYGQEEDRRRAKEAGFDHHITKPAEPEALERLLAR